MKQLTCYTILFSNWDFLKDSGVLSNERLEEIMKFCDISNYVPAKLEDGREIKDWWVHKPTGRIFNKHAMDHADHYRNCEILSEFLTEEEINAINEKANSIISARQNKARFDKATKLTEADWNGPVFFSEDIGYDEGYFEDTNALKDYIENWEDHDEEEKPNIDYVWACHVKPSCHIYLDDVFENASQEAHEDFDFDDLIGVEELSAAVDKFNELNKDNVTWSPDYSRAIILDKE